MTHDEECDHDADDGWVSTELEGQPLSGLIMIGLGLQFAANAVGSLNGSLHAVANEFFMAGFRRRAERVERANRRLLADDLASLERGEI